MNSMLRNVLALLVAVWLAIPSTGIGGGGENNSGTGVWILPFSASINVSSLQQATEPRLQIEYPDTSSDVLMKVSSAMGSASAIFIDELSGLPVALPVAGRVVRLPKALQESLKLSGAMAATIVISDAAQVGYVVRVQITAEAKLLLSVD